MTPNWSRRTVLRTIPLTLVTGCLASGGGKNAPTDSPASPSGTGTESPTGTETETPSPEEQVERLPEPSPLATVLVDLVTADDRRAFANQHAIPYRNGTVKVRIVLVSGGDRPDEYLVEVTGTYQDTVLAYVDVDDLVPLAMDEDVRIVRPPTAVKTHTSG